MTDYQLIPVSKTTEWEEAIKCCGLFDTYHTAQYHTIAELQGEGKSYLLHVRSGNNVAVLPILIRRINSISGLESFQCSDITSVYGYPGILTNMLSDSCGADEFRQYFQKSLFKLFTDNSIVAFFTRTNPMQDNSWLIDSMSDVITLSHTVAIDLTKAEKEQLDGMTKGHRYDIRKACQNGVIVEDDVNFDCLCDFIDIYNETMLRVDAHKSYFFPENYYKQLKEFLGNSLKLYIARVDNKIVSASMFLLSDKIIQYHLSGTRSDSFSFNGTKAIIDTVRRWGSDHNYSWLHLGGGVGSADDQLLRFKAGFSRIRLPFKIVKMVVNVEKYRDVCLARTDWLLRNNYRAEMTGYFPEYRDGVKSP